MEEAPITIMGEIKKRSNLHQARHLENKAV
jgi:hypothetical protein